nr:penicillin-binding protein 1A [Acetonema longum]
MAITIIVFIVMITGAGLGFLTASIHSMPSLQGEMRPAASSQIFDVNNRLLTTIHSVENRLPVTINKIPNYLQYAFLAAEDVRFYQHVGIDPKGIIRAVWSNLTEGGISEGGSTITQQLAKNALLTQDQTLKRKLQEAILALQIERHYTKSEIMEMYLNQIYFGAGAYGVQAAAQVYFGKNVENLSVAESAMLAGIPKSPNYYSPFNNPKIAKERQITVLEQMERYGFIDGETAQKAAKTELKFAFRSNQGLGSISYFIDYVTQQLVDKYGADAVYKEGLRIYTTLDLDMQQMAARAMQQLPTTGEDSKGVKQPQGALVALEPRTGYIKAMIGGRGDDQFNRAVLAERQPGSAFKPFVYLAAIESGMTAATIIDDKPMTYGKYSPVNYDRRFRGPVSLRNALELSLNGVTVQLANQIGIDKPLYYAKQMGISTLVMQGKVNDRQLAVSLGGLTRGVTPLEIASAYGVLANHGIKVDPVSILKVVDRSGKVLEQHKLSERAVINERSAYLLTDMMKGVIDHGTGAGANIGRPAAGKTGTTNDYHDAWFIGFTPDLAASVWMGYDNAQALDGITGGTIPARIWKSFMTQALAEVPPKDFPRPDGIVTAMISTKDGLLVLDPKIRDSRSEIFIQGTQPTKPSTAAMLKDDKAKTDKKKPPKSSIPFSSNAAEDPERDNNTAPGEEAAATIAIPSNTDRDLIPPPPPPKPDSRKPVS